ncbi:unnamed protein product [Brassica rapa]|uniref:Uncharacterized protein n=1 Tax=Brassica campestris TaxID=3711 RepID=A0A8D9LXJ8_BRACM|nr:unnamed protein product [Brassica rapa]
MQEDQVDLDDEDVMDMDEIKAHLLENGIDMDVEDFLEKLLEEEIEEVVKEQEEEQGPPGGDVVKKQGLRKRLFKPTISTAGNTKMRVFNALASPRKQAAAKTGARQGDNSKQTEICFPNMMWDNGIIGMKWNQRYSGLVVRRSRMLSSLGLKNVLVQWWQMQLGVLGFVILATVINDCPINQLLFFYHYIVGIKWNVLVLVCCHLGRVRPILLIYAQCSERFWFTGYGFAGFFLGISWGVWTILLYVKQCGSVVCLWNHQTMIRYNLDGEDQIMIPVR